MGVLLCLRVSKRMNARICMSLSECLCALLCLSTMSECYYARNVSVSECMYFCLENVYALVCVCVSVQLCKSDFLGAK